jgi:hypothetical protein
MSRITSDPFQENITFNYIISCFIFQRIYLFPTPTLAQRNPSKTENRWDRIEEKARLVFYLIFQFFLQLLSWKIKAAKFKIIQGKKKASKRPEAKPEVASFLTHTGCVRLMKGIKYPGREGQARVNSRNI